MSNICAIGAIKVFSELNGEIKRNDLVKGLFLINEEVKTFGKRKISNIRDAWIVRYYNINRLIHSNERRHKILHFR